ncbi:MAG: nicotinamide riboside transporter PnuC [Bacteroidota bacterium]
MHYSATTYYQILGAVFAIVIIVLDTREKALARPLSIISTIISFFVYYPERLYAKCLQSVFNAVFHSYGWYQWLYGGKHKTPLQISKTQPATLVRILLIDALGTVVLGSFLSRYSSAHLPYWDSLHTIIALTAHWLLVRKKLESWLLWVVADAIYAVVLYYKGLYVFCGLYVLFIFLASNGYRTWRQSYLKQAATP